MRTHTLVHSSDESNTFLIMWPSGSGLDWHDHGESAAAILVLSGSLTEHREDLAGYEVLWPNFLYTRSKHTRHRIQNLESEPTISLHTYRPPLTTTYEADLELGQS